MKKAKTKRAAYTQEFKLEAIRLVKEGQAKSTTAKILGVSVQTLDNWLRLNSTGKLVGANSRPVSNEQMELSRLRAELARVKMERDILKKATAYLCPLGTSRKNWCEVRLDHKAQATMAGDGAMRSTGC